MVIVPAKEVHAVIIMLHFIIFNQKNQDSSLLKRHENALHSILCFLMDNTDVSGANPQTTGTLAVRFKTA